MAESARKADGSKPFGGSKTIAARVGTLGERHTAQKSQVYRTMILKSALKCVDTVVTSQITIKTSNAYS